MYIYFETLFMNQIVYHKCLVHLLRQGAPLNARRQVGASRHVGPDALVCLLGLFFHTHLVLLPNSLCD